MQAVWFFNGHVINMGVGLTPAALAFGNNYVPTLHDYTIHDCKIIFV